MNNTEIALNDFKKYIIQQSKSNLSKMGKKNTSKLYNSIKGNVKVSANSFELSFDMEEYGNFVDQGVKGKNSSSKAPRSPYKFGSGSGQKGGLTNGIRKWVKQKGIQFKNKKNGQFMTHEATAFLITRSIYNKGIKSSLFFTKPFEKGFARLDDELIEKYGLDVDEFLKYTLNRI